MGSDSLKLSTPLKPPEPAEAPKASWPIFLWAATAWLALSATAPFLHLDESRLGMIATYPPRLVYAAVALLIATIASASTRQGIALAASACAAVFAFHVGVGGRTLAPATAHASPALGPQHLSMLAFNIHEAIDHAEDLRSLVDERGIDIVVLQEVPPHRRPPFVEALDNFEFYWGDENADFEHKNWGPFASLIAVRRGLLKNNAPVRVETAITQYRSFAARFVLRDGQPLWVVNVHTTKAFWVHSGVAGVFTEADRKSQWHVDERDALNTWLKRHTGEPVIVAGDFNAPYYGHNLRLDGMRNAHRVAGRGWHVTFPAALPLWGIDHTLGNDRVHFLDYEVLSPGYSDHLAQLSRFLIAR